MKREAVTTSAPAIAIQATARRYLARRRRNKLVEAKQIEWEMTTMAKEMIRFCAERARLRKIAVKRSGEEGSGSFRLEGRAFNKLFASTPGMFSSSFLATDVDLVFARVKDKDEKTLTYAQFAAALNVVAATLFPEVTIRGYLGRKRFRQKKLESDKVARTALESLESLGRRYCARCRAIRLAQAKISKFIDPTTHLPYWLHPTTGVTTWTKPKVFGAADVEHAMMVATSKTEHLVKCSVCDVRPVRRMCTSCRDSYCEECFQALHGRGKRRAHVAPVIHVCCVCKYQHATRICETCTFKVSTTSAYCDVCFFNKHPGLDNLSKAEAAAIEEGRGGGGVGRAKAWSLTAAKKQEGWTPLVVTCVECRRYAARWLCDDCEEVYCVGCYAFVHKHGTKVNHGAEKLPYYPASLHMEYAMACRKRSRKERDEEARTLWLEDQARAKERAAVRIQARWRGKIGRIEGLAHLKAGRARHRAEWRQRKKDDRKRKALWYEALDLAGLAPRLASDRLDEHVLKRGIVRRGFDIGTVDELKDQATRGGIRLPGGHTVKTGHRCIYTDPAYVMGDFLKPENIIRVQGELFKVETVRADRIRVDRVWNKRGSKRVLLYKMVLNPRQKLLLGVPELYDGMHLAQLHAPISMLSFVIKVTLVLEEDVINRMLRKAAKYYKRKRRKRLYTLAKKTLKKSEENVGSLKLKLNIAQFGLDNSGDLDGEKKAAATDDGAPETAESALAWIEVVNGTTGRPLWRNTVTGEESSVPPKGMANIENMTNDLEKQKEMLRAKKAKKR
ncbi:unnamed protein product [Ectocarpus sp. CCAP 1310/34]|nr:unnamed protein product [Ectocarpus sp. CCAP 1310/34]